MTVNTTQDFAVEAGDPDRDDRLTYLWSLNGQEVTREKRWQFRAPPTPGTYTVEVEVSDLAGVNKQQVWKVIVKAIPFSSRPPVWRFSEPGEGRLRVQVGQPQNFAVVADMSEGTQGGRTELRYVWAMNGETQPVREGRFRLTDTSRPGTSEVVAVAISPEGLKSVPKRWTVEFVPLKLRNKVDRRTEIFVSVEIPRQFLRQIR